MFCKERWLVSCSNRTLTSSPTQKTRCYPVIWRCEKTDVRSVGPSLQAGR